MIMKIKFGDAVLDLSTIETPVQFMDFLEKVEGQTINLLPKNKDKGLSKYEKFDSLLPREQALMNLYIRMKESRDLLRDRLFPTEVFKAYQMVAAVKQEANYVLPAVDDQKFEYLSKLTIFTMLCHGYLDSLIYARLGYNLALKIGNDGKIYALKDLRELHKSPTI